MYKAYIKDKHSLVDLARYGSKSRKSVHSDILIGEHPPFPMFKEGDILDANATLNLVNCAYDQGKVYKSLSAKIDSVEEEVTESINQCSSEIQQVAEKQERDAQELKEYIDTEIERTTIRLVYDDTEENLIIIK